MSDLVYKLVRRGPLSLGRVRNKVQREGRRAIKHAAQWTQGTNGPCRALFVVGAQRSGTNMLMSVLDRLPSTRTYNEDHPRAFEGEFRIRPLGARAQLLRAPCDWAVFKALNDSQNIDRLLTEHPGAKAIWIYRDFRDVSNSAEHRWSTAQRHILKHIVERPEWVAWYSERMSAKSRETLTTLYDADITENEAGALKWLSRNQLYFDRDLQSRKDVLLIRYEDVVASPKTAFEQVRRFLGLPIREADYAHVFSTSVRRHPHAPLRRPIEDACAAMLARLDEAKTTTWSQA